jgi:phage minor structural protein
MIPILYEKNETEFENEGLGRLAETISAVVTEERNGVYELELHFPVTGKLFSEIQVGRIIACTHDDGGDVQPFDIYKKSEPIGGIVTYYGHHISYRLNEIVVRPFTANTCASALAAMKSNSIGTNPFSISTDKDVTAEYKNTTPHSFRAMLGGEENSILDVYGKGEYEFDKWNVILHTNRGIARSTQIRYGKNLVDYTNEMDAGDTYTAVVPYWYGEVSTGDSDPAPTLVTLPENIITSGQAVPSGREVAVPLDMSTYFQNPPTEAELRDAATAMLSASDAWIPNQTITVDFVAMWQTDEYKDIAPLQSVKLCDTVAVVMSLYGVSYRTKVIKTVYNVIADRYDQIQLGDKPDSLASAITSTLGSQFTDIQQKIQSAEAKAEYAVSIAGDENQYFWFNGTGTDTGAHVTQVDRDTWQADPTMGGGNLLARSNGIAIRDGLDEMLTATTQGVQIRAEGREGIKVTTSAMSADPTKWDGGILFGDSASANAPRISGGVLSGGNLEVFSNSDINGGSDIEIKSESPWQYYDSEGHLIDATHSARIGVVTQGGNFTQYDGANVAMNAENAGITIGTGFDVSNAWRDDLVVIQGFRQEQAQICEATVSANVTMSFSGTYSYKNVPFNSEYTRGGACILDTSTGAITLMRPGWYEVSAIVNCNQAAYIRIALNGSAYARSLAMQGISGSYNSVVIPSLLFLNDVVYPTVSLQLAKTGNNNPTVAVGSRLVVRRIG